MRKKTQILIYILLSQFVCAQTIEDYSNPQRYWFWWPFNINNETVERPQDAWEHWGCYNCFDGLFSFWHYNTELDTFIYSDVDTFPYNYEGCITARHNANTLEPKTIYGIAITVWDSIQRWDDTAAWLFAKDTMFTGVIVIGDYIRGLDTASLPFAQIHDTAHFKPGVNVWTENLFKFVPTGYGFSCPDSIYHVIEVYFEHPHIMTDTFWTGQRLYVYQTEATPPNSCCPKYGNMAIRDPSIDGGYFIGGLYNYSYNGMWVSTAYYHGSHWGYHFPIIAPPPCFVIPPLKIRNVRNTSVDIMWDNPVSSVYRRIELGPAGFTPGTGIVIDNFYGDSIHFQNLAPDLDYEVHVSSFCSTDSVYTEPTVAFFSTAMNCDKVQNLAVADITDSTAILFWRMTSLSDYSELEYGPAGFSHGEGRLLSPIYSLGTGNCSRMMDSLQPGTAYTAYARTWCDYSEMYSDWERVDFTTTGVNPNDTAGHDTTSIATAVQQRVTLVPNPATNSVTITAEAEILSVDAYNVKGQRIATSEAHGTTLKLDTSTWPNGTYTITIRTVQGSVSRKLVIKK